MNFLALTLYLLARIILTFILSTAIFGCFQKLNFLGFNLVIWNFELPSEVLYALVSYSQNSLFYVKIIAFLLKIRDSLLCVTNRCIQVTSKLILPSISRFKFCPHYKSRVKNKFVSNVSQSKLVTKQLTPTDSGQTHNVRTILCNFFWVFVLSPKKLLKVGL